MVTPFPVRWTASRPPYTLRPKEKGGQAAGWNGTARGHQAVGPVAGGLSALVLAAEPAVEFRHQPGLAEAAAAPADEELRGAGAGLLPGRAQALELGLAADERGEGLVGPCRSPVAWLRLLAIVRLAGLAGEDVAQVQRDLVERRDAGALSTIEGGDDLIAAVLEAVGDELARLRPDQPVIRDTMALQQQRNVAGVFLLVAGGDDLADPVRGQVDDAAGALRQPLLGPAGEIVGGAHLWRS